jgi:hypothetical protein
MADLAGRLVTMAAVGVDLAGSLLINDWQRGIVAMHVKLG